MNLFEDTNPRALKDLLTEIHNRTTVLPDFQRDFVWEHFHTQAVITGKPMAEEGIDDHQVFPAAYLERRGVAPTCLRDCVLNRTLIDRTTNQMISDRVPFGYLAEIRDTPGFPFETVLASHGLPCGRGLAASARRLRGIPRMAAGAAVAGDPARHGRDGGRRSGGR